MMRSARLHALGALDQIVVEDAPVPELPATGVLVRVAAVGLGFVDGLLALGGYQVKPALPFTPGNEIAGEVAAIGQRVTDFAVGDSVVATCFGGGLADLCVVDASAAHGLPAGLSPEIAASLPINYATAIHALRDRAALATGETLLVLGAAGGTGAAAVEVGKLLGARVIGCASTSAKRDVVRALGADAVLATDEPEWREALRQLNGGRGVDVVFDPVGGALFEPAFRSLAWRGRYLVVGFAAGAIPALPTNLPLLKGAALVGVDLRQFNQLQPGLARANMRTVLDWAGDAKLQVPIGARFPLARAAEALTASMNRDTHGKVIVIVDES